MTEATASIGSKVAAFPFSISRQIATATTESIAPSTTNVLTPYSLKNPGYFREYISVSIQALKMPRSIATIDTINGMASFASSREAARSSSTRM